MYKLPVDRRLIMNNVLVGDTFEKNELIDYLIDELNDLKRELEDVSSKLYETERELEELEGDLDNLQVNYDYLERAKEDLDQKFLTMEVEKEDEIDSLKERIDALEEQVAGIFSDD